MFSLNKKLLLKKEKKKNKGTQVNPNGVKATSPELCSKRLFSILAVIGQWSGQGFLTCKFA